MEHLIEECNDFLRDCNLTYAFCGGYALELFTNEKRRTHSDVDITLFSEDRNDIIDYILKKGWEVYEHLQSPNCLRKITNQNDEGALNCLYLWAIKPGCSFFHIKQQACDSNIFDFEILDKEQKNFDFIDIIFNTRKDNQFICDQEKQIKRPLDQAILCKNKIPFLAPEVILFIIANPAYLESDYHREKNNIDFESVPPLLPKESLDWLIDAILKAYPEGNKRLDQLRALQKTF